MANERCETEHGKVDFPAWVFTAAVGTLVVYGIVSVMLMVMLDRIVVAAERQAVATEALVEQARHKE